MSLKPVFVKQSRGNLLRLLSGALKSRTLDIGASGAGGVYGFTEGANQLAPEGYDPSLAFRIATGLGMGSIASPRTWRHIHQAGLSNPSGYAQGSLQGMLKPLAYKLGIPGGVIGAEMGIKSISDLAAIPAAIRNSAETIDKAVVGTPDTPGIAQTIQEAVQGSKDNPGIVDNLKETSENLLSMAQVPGLLRTGLIGGGLMAGTGLGLYGLNTYLNNRRERKGPARRKSTAASGESPAKRKPGHLRIDIPAERVSDSFYKGLSRDLLFDNEHWENRNMKTASVLASYFKKEAFSPYTGGIDYSRHDPLRRSDAFTGKLKADNIRQLADGSLSGGVKPDLSGTDMTGLHSSGVSATSVGKGRTPGFATHWGTTSFFDGGRDLADDMSNLNLTGSLWNKKPEYGKGLGGFAKHVGHRTLQAVATGPAFVTDMVSRGLGSGVKGVLNDNWSDAGQHWRDGNHDQFLKSVGKGSLRSTAGVAQAGSSLLPVGLGRMSLVRGGRTLADKIPAFSLGGLLLPRGTGVGSSTAAWLAAGQAMDRFGGMATPPPPPPPASTPSWQQSLQRLMENGLFNQGQQRGQQQVAQNSADFNFYQ